MLCNLWNHNSIRAVRDSLLSIKTYHGVTWNVITFEGNLLNEMLMCLGVNVTEKSAKRCTEAIAMWKEMLHSTDVKLGVKEPPWHCIKSKDDQDFIAQGNWITDYNNHQSIIINANLLINFRIIFMGPQWSLILRLLTSLISIVINFHIIVTNITLQVVYYTWKCVSARLKNIYFYPIHSNSTCRIWYGIS